MFYCTAVTTNSERHDYATASVIKAMGMHNAVRPDLAGQVTHWEINDGAPFGPTIFHAHDPNAPFIHGPAIGDRVQVRYGKATLTGTVSDRPDKWGWAVVLIDRDAPLLAGDERSFSAEFISQL